MGFLRRKKFLAIIKFKFRETFGSFAGIFPWNAEVERRDGTPRLNAKMERHGGTPRWNATVEHHIIKIIVNDLVVGRTHFPSEGKNKDLISNLS